MTHKTLKDLIEEHAASRGPLAGRIAAIGDEKLTRFFSDESQKLEAVKAEVFNSAAPEPAPEPEAEQSPATGGRRPKSARVMDKDDANE